MKMDEVRRVKQVLCERHFPLCLTTKCPMAKFECYAFPIEVLWRMSTPVVKRKMAMVLREVGKDDYK